MRYVEIVQREQEYEVFLNVSDLREYYNNRLDISRQEIIEFIQNCPDKCRKDLVSFTDEEVVTAYIAE